MNKILFSIFAILLGFNIAACAKESVTINGSSNLIKAEYDSLEVNGVLAFQDLSIKNSIIVNGSLAGKNLKCRSMESNGSVDIDGLQTQTVEINGSFSAKNVAISGTAIFNGAVKIANGTIQEVEISSKAANMTNVVVNGNINIRSGNNNTLPQILRLQGKTVVKGDVIFEEDGKIYLSDSAKIEGQVVNASIIQK